MRGQLHLEERVAIAREMLNRSVGLYDGLRLSPARRRRLNDFTLRVMSVLFGERGAVPRRFRSMARPVRRER